MSKKTTAQMENWFIDGDRLRGQVYGHGAFAPGERVTTSTIVQNGAPNYIETCNTVYLLGEPAAKPLTGIQAQAVAVVRKALIDDVSRDGGSLLTDIMGEQAVSEAAEGTAQAAIRALIGAGLLVS